MTPPIDWQARCKALEELITKLIGEKSELQLAIKDYVAAVLDREGVHFIDGIADLRSREIVMEMYEDWLRTDPANLPNDSRG